MIEYHCGYYTIIKAVRSQIPQDEWLLIRHEHLARGNIKTHFLPGHKTWNKGLKSFCPSPATQFKKGHLPANHKALGTIVIHKPKRDRPYRMIAIVGPSPNRHKWIPYAQYLWEKKYGPVPPELFVAHIDGDGLHDEISNYKLVDRAGNMELMKKNKPGWRKKASESLKKSWRIRWRIRQKAQKKAEEIKKQQARLLQAAVLEAEQKKNAEAEMILIYGQSVHRWDCYGCSAEYYQEQMPERCEKCGSHSFEQNIYRKKAG